MYYWFCMMNETNERDLFTLKISKYLNYINILKILFLYRILINLKDLRFGQVIVSFLILFLNVIFKIKSFGQKMKLKWLTISKHFFIFIFKIKKKNICNFDFNLKKVHTLHLTMTFLVASTNTRTITYVDIITF